MKRRILTFVLAGALLTAAALTAIPTVRADIGDLLKGAGIVLLVDKFSDQLNKFINTLTVNKNLRDDNAATKVVPIISIGQKGFVGAAQVSGPEEQVSKVKGVAQLETKMSSFRIKVLVPVESKSAVKDIKRVPGVGVSAVIDVRL